MVEQRFACFKADGHAGAVNLGQDVARQPDFEIGILGAVERVTRGGIGHCRDIAVLGTVALKAAFEAVGEQRRALLGRGHTNSAGIGLPPAQCERGEG